MASEEVRPSVAAEVDERRGRGEVGARGHVSGKAYDPDMDDKTGTDENATHVRYRLS
jgi:hypothetical protein